MENPIPNIIPLSEFIEKLNSSSTAPIGPKAVYHLIRQPDFPAIMIGYRYYVMIDRVEAWMMAQASRKVIQETSEVMADGQ